MSTIKLETYVPKAGVNKSRSKMGLWWDRMTKPAEEPPYRPLPEHHIRVAKIKPGTKDHPLRIKLRHVDPRNTKYIALSYTWDTDPSQLTTSPTNSSSDSHHPPPQSSSNDKPKTTTLICGGVNFRVRQNLYGALCQLRDIQSDVPVFVDALCINFSDDSERASYLEIMGHIYARAASVVIYLGPKTPHADDTMLNMRKCVNAIDWRRIGDANDPNSTYNFRDPHFFRNIGMEPLTLKQWRHIHDFCQMHWFTRYWAFFELALAKNPLFLWGEACMDFNFLVDFGMILALSGWLDELRQISTENLDTELDTNSSVGLTKMLGPVARLRSSPPWSPKNDGFNKWMRHNYNLESEHSQMWMFFEILLRSAEAFECRDPRDRVYAPLALARAAYGGKPINKTWPRPDYSKSPDLVLKEFAEIIQRETGQPSILAAGIEIDTNPDRGQYAERGRQPRPRKPFG